MKEKIENFGPMPRKRTPIKINVLYVLSKIRSPEKYKTPNMVQHRKLEPGMASWLLSTLMRGVHPYSFDSQCRTSFGNEVTNTWHSFLSTHTKSFVPPMRDEERT